MKDFVNPFAEGTDHHRYADNMMRLLNTREWNLFETPDGNFHTQYNAGMGSYSFREQTGLHREVTDKLIANGDIERREKPSYIYGLGDVQARIVPPEPPPLSMLFKDATHLERAVQLLDELTSEDETNKAHFFIRKKNGEYALLRFKPHTGGHVDNVSPTEGVILSRLVSTEWLLPDSQDFKFHDDLVEISGHELDEETGEHDMPITEPDSGYAVLYRPADFDYNT